MAAPTFSGRNFKLAIPSTVAPKVTAIVASLISSLLTLVLPVTPKVSPVSNPPERLDINSNETGYVRSGAGEPVFADPFTAAFHRDNSPFLTRSSNFWLWVMAAFSSSAFSTFIWERAFIMSATDLDLVKVDTEEEVG